MSVEKCTKGHIVDTKGMPLVSIIIPTYNRAKSLITTIESIISQTYKNLEIIVVDDGSLDDTEQRVDKVIKANIAHCIKFYKQNNSGAPVARNLGFLKSSGDYIVFFDSDDIMLPNRVEMQLHALLYGNAQCCACGFYYSTEGGRKYIPPMVHGNALELNVKGQLLGSTQSWIFCRKLIEQVDGFDTGLTCKQDSDLTFRILSLRPHVAIVKEPLSIFLDDNRPDRIMKASSNRLGIMSRFTFYFRIVNMYINDFCLYKNAIKRLAGELAKIHINSLKDSHYVNQCLNLNTSQMTQFNRIRIRFLFYFYYNIYRVYFRMVLK